MLSSKKQHLFNKFLRALRFLSYIALSILFLFSLPSNAERGEVIPSKSKITFRGTSNFHSFKGSINKISGFIYGDSKDVKSVNYLQLEFDPLSFTTNNVARDENMKKMFNVKSSPLIRFRSTNVLVSHDKAFADITGKLTINNTTKKINFTAYLSKSGSKSIKAKGKFTIKLSDFKLKPPAPGFIRVKNNVVVEFEALADWYN